MNKARPRVVLLTADGAYSRLFLQSFIETAQVDVVGLVLSSATLNRGVTGLSGLWAFVGRVGLCYALYQAYVCWVLPWVKGLKPCTSLPLLHTHDVNQPDAAAWIRKLNPDYLLSFHFNQKLLQPLIELPKLAALNFHPSYLPMYRGVDPVLFALQECDGRMGGSIHRVASTIDAGDILLRESLADDYVGGLISTNSHLFTLGGRMATEVMSDFANYHAQRLVQAELGPGRYDDWAAVGRLGCVGLLKALWARAK